MKKLDEQMPWSVTASIDRKTCLARNNVECRNCNHFEFMDFAKQGRRGLKQHSEGLETAKTCIDGHKGIAHELPVMHDVDPTSVVGTL